MRSILLLLLTVSCQSEATQQASPSSPSPEKPVDLSDWRSEFVALPPGFAPGLPKGREVVMFAPGWSTAGADDLWSYVILMEVEGTEWNEQSIDGLFELYFDGLIGAVGSSKPFELPEDPAECSFKHAGGTHYTGVVNTFDAFGDGAPLQLHMTVDVLPLDGATSQLRVAASPHTSDYEPVWHPMRSALNGLTLP